MSTTIAFPKQLATPARQRSSAAVRLTRRGRVVLVAVFLMVATVAFALFGDLATASRDAGTAPSVQVVRVQPGETLYEIAGRLAEPGEVREMVHEIRQLNSLSGSGLSAGQELAVPR